MTRGEMKLTRQLGQGGDHLPRVCAAGPAPALLSAPARTPLPHPAVPLERTVWFLRGNTQHDGGATRLPSPGEAR